MIVLLILLGVISVGALGYILNFLINYLPMALSAGETVSWWQSGLILDPMTWILGGVTGAIFFLLYILIYGGSFVNRKKVLRGSRKDAVESALENARFMTEKEREFNFPHKMYKKLGQEKKDGIPVYAVYSAKKKDVDINLASGMHSIIIGATGSGKTTTFMNPAIQIIGSTSAKSSMIMTDPKGELFQLHSQYLVERGYKVMVLDLRDPYNSYRWNPLGDIYDRYQKYLVTGNDIYVRNIPPQETDLKMVNPPEAYGDEWYEYDGKAYAVRKELLGILTVARQKVYDELYEDLNDLIGVLCPIESKDDPVWEKGARSVALAVAMGMLEDSEDPDLGMTREKFCFYNINKAIGNSDDGYKALKEYFAGRPKLSKATALSRQVMSAPDDTLNSYMSIALDKFSLFNDEGLCALTSDTDINPTEIATKPIALFLKIPDEKDTRHALAAVFILSIYKALIKYASAQPDLSLPKNVYFLLDEFGNMPKIDKFDKMITVGRSRKIWFNMIVQSFAQIDNVYGKTVSDILKGNCGMKMFIGSNDIETCEEFSKLCGNYTVSTASVSGNMQGSNKEGLNVSTQLQQRPLIYPSELQKLNNKTDTGNAIIVTFGNNPLKTKFTPSYRCPLYKMGTMDMTEVSTHAFFRDEVYYDLEERNYSIQEKQAQAEAAEQAEQEEQKAAEQPQPEPEQPEMEQPEAEQPQETEVQEPDYQDEAETDQQEAVENDGAADQDTEEQKEYPDNTEAET